LRERKEGKRAVRGVWFVVTVDATGLSGTNNNNPFEGFYKTLPLC